MNRSTRLRVIAVVATAILVWTAASTSTDEPHPAGIGGPPGLRGLADLGTAGGEDPTAALIGPTPIPHDIPAAERVLDDGLPSIPSRDREAVALSDGAGTIVVLVSEDFELHAVRSVDGGATFSPETIVAGRPGDPPVQRDLVATAAEDGTIYALFRIADPDGDVGLQMVKSADFGGSWSDPIDILRHADPEIGVQNGGLVVSAGTAGRVAVGMLRWWGNDPYVRVSSDHGVTWQPWVRVNAGVAELDAGSQSIAVLADGAGIVHVAFDENRGATREMFYTRSTDGGLTFEAERSLTPDLPAGEQERSESPAFVEADDGGVLLAFWDGFGSDRVHVLRSTDGGQTFARVAQQELTSSDVPVPSDLVTASGTSTVLLRVAYSNGTLTIQRSPDHGQSFAAPMSLTNTAWFDGSPPFPTALARTASGDWVAAWDDVRNDSYIDTMRDIFVRISTDDGVTWGADLRVDGTAPGTARSELSSVVGTGADEFAVVYLDAREDTIDDDIWLNRTGTAAPDFSLNEIRVESDVRMRNPPTNNTVNVASAGDGTVYAVFASHSPGRYADVFVRRSDDGGYAFGDTVRVSSSAPGSRASINPQIAAFADGHVYVAFKERHASGDTRLHFNRSTDSGATWLPADVELGATTINGAFGTGFPHREFELTALPDGRVYVLWSDGRDLRLARSTDFGGTFSIDDVDQDSRANRRNGQGSLCVAGDQVVLTFTSHSPLPGGFVVPSVWGTVSQDGGATWDTRVHFRPESNRQLYWAGLPAIDCGEGGVAVVAFTDYWPGDRYKTFWNRWNGASWDGDQQLSTSNPYDEAFHRVAHLGGSAFLMAFTDFAGVHTTRSTDGGSSWESPTRHDGDLTPEANSLDPYLAADGAGNVWMTWQDSTSGSSAIAVRHSSDSAATWSETYRLDREPSQGGFANLRSRYGGAGYADADAGVAYFVWSAERSSTNYDAPFSAWDTSDFDRDVRDAAADCDDSDPGVWLAPVDVDSVLLEALPGGTVRATWASQDAARGPATTYDLIAGSLADLRTTGAFGAATCIADGHDDSPFDDDRPAPAPGEGEYLLVRAVNPCGTGSYGDSSLGTDPRDDLDASGPCP